MEKINSLLTTILLFCLTPLILGAALILLASSPARADVPYQMNFQGRLNDSTGAPMASSTYNIRFRIYAAKTGGSALWTETQAVAAAQGVVVTTGGLFSTQLGSVTSLPTGIWNTTAPLYLEVELPTPATATSSSPSWTEGAMGPRNPIVSSPFALNSQMLNGQLASYYRNASNINAGTLSNSRLTGSGQLTVATGTGLLGGGSVALGATRTISLDTSYLDGRYLTGTPNDYIQNQTASSQTASFRIGGTGSVVGNFSIGSAVSAGNLLLASGGGYNGTLSVASGLASNVAYVLPATSQSIVEVCTSSGNCVPNGVAVGDTLYWDGTKWVTLGIGAEGQYLAVDNTGKPAWMYKLSVGDTGPGGGIVFYDKGTYSNGWRFLEAAPSGWDGGSDDPFTGSPGWGCSGVNISGAEGTGLGDGKQNTADIVAGCATNNIAADLARDYTGGGLSDWYLGSTAEMQEMYAKRSYVTGLDTSGSYSEYWTSKEMNSTNAIAVDMSDGYDLGMAKSDKYTRVRPIRRF